MAYSLERERQRELIMAPKDGLIHFLVSYRIKSNIWFPTLPATVIANGKDVVMIEKNQRFSTEYGIPFHQLVDYYKKEHGVDATPSIAYDFTPIVRKYYPNLLAFMTPVEDIQLIQLPETNTKPELKLSPNPTNM